MSPPSPKPPADEAFEAFKAVLREVATRTHPLPKPLRTPPKPAR